MADREDDRPIGRLDSRNEAPTAGWPRRGWLIVALIAAALIVYHVTHGGIQRHLVP